MKNIVENSWGKWYGRFLPVLLSLLLFAGCEMDSEMHLPLNVDSNRYVLSSGAGSTRVQIYSSGEWTVSLSEDVDWASIDRLAGSGYCAVLFKYAANYGVARSVDVVFTRGGLTQVVQMVQEGKDPVINVDDSRVQLPANAWNVPVVLESNLKENYEKLTHTVTYLPNEEDEDEDEPLIDSGWMENFTVSAEAVNFAVKENASGRVRKALVRLTYVEPLEKEHIVEFTVTQDSERASLDVAPSAAKTTRKGAVLKAELTHNLGYLAGELTFDVRYEGAESDWLSEIGITDGVLSVNVAPNESGAARKASLVFKLGDIEFPATYTIEQTFEADYRLLIEAESGEVVIDDAGAFLDAVVISDRGNGNVAGNPNTERSVIDYTVNDKTAYVQMPDGGYGYRLQTATVEDNVFERYSTVRISLNGLTLRKEANPERYTLSGVTAAHVVSSTPGVKESLAVKERTISQLTDEDLYTYVTLKDVEFALPDGCYTNVNEGYFQKHASCVPRALCDKDGNLLYFLVNNKAPWRRDGSAVPAGSGSVGGIIVHERLPRYGLDNEGDLGRYSVRTLEKEDIELAPSSSASNYTPLVVWNWSDATLKLNDDKTLAPDRGEGALWCTDPAATVAVANEYCGLTTDGALPGKQSVSFEGTWWWNTTADDGYAVAMKFSTLGANGKLLLQFTNSQGNQGGTSIYGPAFWHIEYSTDGVNFTELPASTFCCRPFAFWQGAGGKDMSYCAAPSHADRVFVLPESLCNQAEVTLLIKASGKECILSNTATVEQGIQGVIDPTWDNKYRSPMRFGTISVKCNK